MKKTIRRGAALLTGLAMLCSLAGCGETTPKEEVAPSVQEGFVPALDTKTESHIVVAGHYSNFEALEEEFNRFNEYYPNVELSYVQLDDYNHMIDTALYGSDAPDIFFTYAWMFTGEGNQEVMEAAEDLSQESLGLNLDCIREQLLTKDAEGHVPAVPVYFSTYGMLVNEALFEKEGIEIPKTYPELLAACEAFQKAGYSSPVMGYNRGSFLTFPLYYPCFCAKLLEDEAALTELNEMGPGAGEAVRDTLELVEDFMGHGFVDLDACNEMENDYEAVILRFFEGDVPMMMASAGTVSGTSKREALSEAFSAAPFAYSFHPVPSTEEGGYFLNILSMGFSINKNSEELQMANEFMRFLVDAKELGLMAQAKRMVSPCTDMSLDGIYASFGELAPERVINMADVGISEVPDMQLKQAAWKVSNDLLTVDEAVEAFGSLES